MSSSGSDCDGHGHDIFDYQFVSPVAIIAPSTAPTWVSPATNAPAPIEGKVLLSRSRDQRRDLSGDSLVGQTFRELRMGTGFGEDAEYLPPLTRGCEPVAGTEAAIKWPAQKIIIRDILKQHIFTTSSDAYIERELKLLDFRGHYDSDIVPVANQDLTCFVLVSRDDSSSWGAAIRALEEEFLSRRLRGFRFELCDPFAYEPQSISQVRPNHPLVNAWSSLKQEIWEFIDEKKFDWVSLSVARLTPAKHEFEDSATIIVAAPRDTYKQWQSLHFSISQLLRTKLPGVNTGTAVLIAAAPHPLSAGLDNTSRGAITIDAFRTTNIRFGDSLAPQELSDTSATAGGSLKLINPDDGDEVDAVLTVFHAFRTLVSKEVLAKGCKPGENPGVSNTAVKVTSPSTQDRKIVCESIEAQIEAQTTRLDAIDKEDPSKEKRLARLKQYLESDKLELVTLKTHEPYAGIVWSMGRFSPLDWALIKLDDARIPDNQLPHERDTQMFRNIPGKLGVYENDTQKIPGIVEEVKEEDVVWKKGRTTDITIGVVSKFDMETKVNFDEEPLFFKARQIIPCKNVGGQTDIIKPGDSGAWVFGLNGEWYGMVFAEISIYTIPPVYGFIEARHIVEDIEAVTGYKVADPPKHIPAPKFSLGLAFRSR